VLGLKRNRLKLLACVAAAAPAVQIPLSAIAAEIGYVAKLTGASASPPNDSAGIGSAVVRFDPTFSLLHIEVVYVRLSSPATAAHIQGVTLAPGAGVAESLTTIPSLSGFIAGATSGSYHGVLDLNSEFSYNPAFVAAHGGSLSQAKSSLKGGLDSGRTYVNIRTSAFDNGEIRGFLAPTPTADFDFSGAVDGFDLTLWKIAFAGANFGDANEDGDTDGDDFLAWQRQLGQVAEFPSQTPAATPAPEPNSLLLTLYGLLGARRVATNSRSRKRASPAGSRIRPGSLGLRRN
jgi:hypothetical protein